MKQLILLIILLNTTTTSTLGCRIGSGTGEGTSGARATLEPMVTNSVVYTNNIAQTQFINKVMAYRILKATPTIMNGSSILSNFYTTAQSNCMQGFCGIEETLMADSLTAAQTKITTFSPSNAIEGNYKSYYQIYKRTKDNSYSATDSLALINLANSCPYVDGGVVYQARALYNGVYDGYYKFNNPCSVNNSRLINTTNVETVSEKDINVILKSKLYPNPNIGTFNIELTDKTTTQVEISIFDITGKQILNENKTINNSIINLDYDLLNGTYLVKIKLNNGSVDVHRIVIAK